MTKQKVCFFVAPIGKEDSEDRKRSDVVMKYIVEPPAHDNGYKVIRADQIERPGIITSQVIQHVLESELIVADLTDRNPNVFYELALRHATRKPFIQLIQKGQELPFDVSGVRTISIDHRDIEAVEKSKAEIAAQIRELEASPLHVESPVSSAIEIENLKRSAQPVERYLAEIREILALALPKLDRTDLLVSELHRALPAIWEKSKKLTERIYDGQENLHHDLTSSVERTRHEIQELKTDTIPKAAVNWAEEVERIFKQLLSSPGLEEFKKTFEDIRSRSAQLSNVAQNVDEPTRRK